MFLSVESGGFEESNTSAVSGYIKVIVLCGLRSVSEGILSIMLKHKQFY